MLKRNSTVCSKYIHRRLEMVESCLSSNHSTNLQAPGISPEGSHLIVRSSIRLRRAKISFTVLSSLPFSTKYHPHWPSSHGCDSSGDPLWKWCKCGALETQTSGQGTQDLLKTTEQEDVLIKIWPNNWRERGLDLSCPYESVAKVFPHEESGLSQL